MPLSCQYQPSGQTGLDGTWSLGTPAKSGEVRQEESGFKGVFSSRSLKGLWEFGGDWHRA